MKALPLIGAATALLLALAGCGSSSDGVPRRSTSTLHATWVDRQGDGQLQPGPGEPLTPRTALAPASRPVRTLASLAVFTDAHVRDTESPLRADQLDRLGPPFQSTFRPQEALSAQVLGGTLAAIDAARPEAVVELGDLIDNAQGNELDRALAVMRGGRVRPDSGTRGYEGPQAAGNPDPAYYRPGTDAPRHPGLLARAVAPFDSPGLRAPWYPVLGNHDVLVQGELPPSPALDRVAVGDRRLVALDPDIKPPRREDGLAGPRVARLLRGGLPGRTVAVAPDPRRRPLPAGDVVEGLAAASAERRAPVSGLLDYVFDVGAVRGIVLDEVRRDGGSAPRVSPERLAWLAGQLRAAGIRPVLVFAHQPLRDPALRVLDRAPGVVAVMTGDTHRNKISPRRTRSGGYWLVNTGSLADWPMQARMLRVVRTADGGLALETWMLNAAGDLSETARQLAYLDAQGGRPAGFAGRPRDRNATLYVPPR